MGFGLPVDNLISLDNADGRVTTVPVHAGEVIGPACYGQFFETSNYQWKVSLS